MTFLSIVTYLRMIVIKKKEHDLDVVLAKINRKEGASQGWSEERIKSLTIRK